MSDPDLVFDVTELVLERIKHQRRIILSPAAEFKGVALKAYFTKSFDQTIIQLIASVLGKRHNPIERRVPASWFQHFKADVMRFRWWGRWFVRRRPVVWTTIVINVAETYPELDGKHHAVSQKVVEDNNAL